VLASEVDGVSGAEVVQTERRDRDRLGLQIVESFAQSGKVGWFRQNGEANFATKSRLKIVAFLPESWPQRYLHFDCTLS